MAHGYVPSFPARRPMVEGHSGSALGAHGGGKPPAPTRSSRTARWMSRSSGGGYTGLSTALHCASKGLSVQVLEAGGDREWRVGAQCRGSSMRGVWMPLRRRWRRPWARPTGRASLRRFCDGPEVVFDLIEKHQIRCEATRSGTGVHARPHFFRPFAPPGASRSRAPPRRLAADGRAGRPARAGRGRPDRRLKGVPRRASRPPGRHH